MTRRRARLQVVAAAHAGADDEGDLLAGVEILLGRGRSHDRRQRGGREQSETSRPEIAIRDVEHSSVSRASMVEAASARADSRAAESGRNQASGGKFVLSRTFGAVYCHWCSGSAG
jgi:hypothetical protein